MKYLDKTFSVSVGGEAFARGWEATFGRKEMHIGTVVEVEPAKLRSTEFELAVKYAVDVIRKARELGADPTETLETVEAALKRAIGG